MSTLWAYVDPSSGSILLQVILAAIIGTVGFFLRPIWRLGRALLGRKPQEPPAGGDS